MSYQYNYGMPDMYMEMYESQRRLMDMYPDVYNRMYPVVRDVCLRHDQQSNPKMYPYVDPSMLQQMVDEAYYMDCCRPYIQQYGGGIFRDLLSILFIRELLGRRRRPFYGPYYGGSPFLGY